ncbi:hypothetical protein LSH36_1344g00048 [Paralvinella palmiformis]|uniref:VWFA domain-containing protein n=1 Tax=Paralvinella palmiformis TaxID=53620 RepID=A0AAD9ITW9_9ANNE|nr:hypothetical protein LSH36_1344g00048 [Paralvinella palmiformis]
MATDNNRWTAVILVTMIAAGVTVIKGQAGKDICFVLDESGSIGTENWQKCKQFVANFIDGTKFGESGTKYGIVKFSETANLAIPLNQYSDKNLLLMAVRNLGYDRGGTAIHSGIRVAREQCFTTENGIGDYELDTLKAIAYSLDGERLFTFENFDQLLNDVSLILDESCRSVREISPAIRSRRYWAGIAPSRRLINLYEGDDKPTDLYFFSTLPIRCEYNGQPDIQCHITLEVSATSNRIAMYQPSTNNFTQIRSCAFKLFYKDWKENESLAYDEHGPLQLLPKKDPHSSNPMTVILSVNVRGQPDTAFEKYHLNNITIFVHDQKPGCSIACAVVVREGKYVLAIDKCNENNELHILKLTTKIRPVNGLEVIDENFLIQMTANPSRTEYMIKTSGGARVVVTLRSRGINIQITLSARDKGKTSGLCGTFDDDPTNDFIPNGYQRNRVCLGRKIALITVTTPAIVRHSSATARATTTEPKTPIDGAECGLNALEDPLSDVDKPQEYVRALIPKYIRNGLKQRGRNVK